MNENINETERQSIIDNIKLQHRESVESRRVYAALVNGEVLSVKPPFFSGWLSGASGHWGLVVDGFFHHVVFELDQDRNPVGVMFHGQNFRQKWIDEGKAQKEELGLTSLPLEAIRSIGDTLIIKFGNYQRLYRNCQTFAEILVQLICDKECKSFGTLSVKHTLASTLIAFPLTTPSGTIISQKQNKFITSAVPKTNKIITWENLVEAEIREEISKITFYVDSKQKCIIIKLQGF